MVFDRFKDASLLLTRLIVAVVFLWHGVEKAFTPEVGVQKFIDMGFPGFLGPIVGGVEVVLALLLIAGLWTRYTSIALAGIIVVAIVGVQLAKGYQSGLERDLLLIATLFILTSFGPGALAIESKMNSQEDEKLAQAQL